MGSSNSAVGHIKEVGMCEKAGVNGSRKPQGNKSASDMRRE